MDRPDAMPVQGKGAFSHYMEDMRTRGCSGLNRAHTAADIYRIRPGWPSRAAGQGAPDGPGPQIVPVSSLLYIVAKIGTIKTMFRIARQYVKLYELCEHFQQFTKLSEYSENFKFVGQFAGQNFRSVSARARARACVRVRDMYVKKERKKICHRIPQEIPLKDSPEIPYGKSPE